MGDENSTDKTLLKLIGEIVDKKLEDKFTTFQQGIQEQVENITESYLDSNLDSGVEDILKNIEVPTDILKLIDNIRRDKLALNLLEETLADNIYSKIKKKLIQDLKPYIKEEIKKYL
ncbi:MAG: hypothetical protein JSW73_00240 [Candidatus Woesearchaeota archaeon]|nr:MAG: hypothetical protein JSW73_00240 [Candidatus Woesearchaeota archaeon]